MTNTFAPGLCANTGRSADGERRDITTIQPGRYRHFKGQEYTVIGVALHSENQEELVVYRQEYGDHGLWVRPKAMFIETVEVEGRQVPRFEYIGT